MGIYVIIYKTIKNADVGIELSLYMKLSFAPLEGITTYTYRNTHAEMFGCVDEYYAPFINPSDLEKISRKGMRDIMPEKNSGLNLKVQVLTSNSESFVKFCRKIKALGYDEVNLNMGCPASTVVRKGRGSGFLMDVSGMDNFFSDVFSACDMKISVKTRTGFSSPEEFPEIMEVYNKYRFSSLIVHPRTREDFYNGEPDIKSFQYAYNISKNNLSYNGDIYSAEDYLRIKERFPGIEGIMLGRGAVRNPALFREIRGGKRLTTNELIDFSERLIERYRLVLGSDTFTLHKLKEVWVYVLQNFPGEKKIAKVIKKSSTVEAFMAAIRALPEL